MIHTNYCSRCRATNKPLVKYAQRGRKQYYYCRDCANEKQKKYNQTATGNIAVRKSLERTQKKYYKKHAARYEVAKALLRGDINKPTACQVCHGEFSRIEGHHPDYDKPLSVLWLCTSCHATIHRS